MTCEGLFDGLVTCGLDKHFIWHLWCFFSKVRSHQLLSSLGISSHFFETLQSAMVAKFLVPLPLVKKPLTVAKDDVKVDPDEVYRRQIRLLQRFPLAHLKKKLKELQELSDAWARFAICAHNIVFVISAMGELKQYST